MLAATTLTADRSLVRSFACSLPFPPLSTNSRESRSSTHWNPGGRSQCNSRRLACTDPPNQLYARVAGFNRQLRERDALPHEACVAWYATLTADRSLVRSLQLTNTTLSLTKLALLRGTPLQTRRLRNYHNHQERAQGSRPQHSLPIGPSSVRSLALSRFPHSIRFHQPPIL